MNLELDQDRQMIRDAAEDFLSAYSDSAKVRAAHEAGGMDAGVWQRIAAELGWCGIAVPEEHGGLGLGLFELALLQEQAGRFLLAAPLFSTACLAAPLLAEAGTDAARQRWLPALAAGELTATVALSARGLDPFAVGDGVRAEPDGNAYVLTGRCRHVPQVLGTDLVIVAVRLGGEPALFALPADTAGATLMPLETLDQGRPVAELVLDGVRLPADSWLDAGDVAAIHRALSHSAIALAAEQLGLAQQCLDLTVAYAQERQQFGRPIAGFQAVKHRLAEVLVKVEAARSAVYGAAAEVDAGVSDKELLFAAASAKSFADAAARFAAQEAIQLHGGVGFTWEYDPHLYFKRAQAFSHWLGSADAWRERVAAQLLEDAA
ncbi:acyl-CoA dehydrogenase family protein [Crenobacter sp. SG2303]|uniref:Acyl-CoA dehydrogenase family protein n=1 Tax=Crenobacter oryzisoli TaxID=3056844 RepID=A0ABT7XJC4_9NEIS|nr:acyl-CoA dehydrogenase family protein [Crenobacter sp. SG2303]MDN0073873.1 acyl-CoA dehydrogenase family protein [Crenobacter sp. SG2303]